MAIQFLNDQYISGTLQVVGAVTFDTAVNPGSDTDKIAVFNGSVLGFRTTAQILSDLGGVTAVTGTQPIISSGGTTPAISLNYTGANNVIESATDLEGTAIVSLDSIIYNDAGDGNVKKGLISDLPFTSTLGTVTSITPGADSGSGTAITTSGTITVAGGTGVTTSVTGTTITVNSHAQYGWTLQGDSGSSSIPSGAVIDIQGGTGITTTLSGSSPYTMDISVDGTAPTGSGTTNSVTKWTSSTALGDGPITFATNDATFAGNITISNSVNRSIILDYTAGSGTYSWVSFKQSGTEQFRIFGDYTSNYLSFYNDQTSTHQLKLNADGSSTFTGSLTAEGINPTSLTTPLIQLQGDLDILNKAQTLYLDFATRDTSGSEVVYNLSNVGTATFAGTITATTNGSTFGNISVDKINLGNDEKVIWGGGSDLQIYHQASDDTSYIFANNTNPLKIATETSGTPITIGHTTSETTIGDNLTVTGTGTFAGGISMSDSILIDYTGSDGQGIDAGLKIMNDASDWGAYIRKKSAANYGLRIDSGGANALYITNTEGGATGTFVVAGDGTTTIAGTIDSGAITSTSTVSGTTATFTTFSGDLNGTINTATTAVTQSAGNNSTKVATTAYTDAAVASIPLGLSYQGTWNATTNTPTLVSGVGTPGYYYIVSVAGTHTLDGISEWAVGDWALFTDSVTDHWQKIDNTSALTGSGTANTAAMWSAGTVLTDAPITFSGNNATFVGNVISEDTFYLENGSGNRWQMLFDTNAFNLRYYNGTSWSADAFAIDTSNNATFAGSITATKAGTAGIFNSGATNTVATFTSTDAGANITLTDTSNRSTIEQNTADLFISSDPDGSTASSTIKFQVDGGTKVTILDSGNVGIGTTTPDANLEVAGDVLINSGEYISWGGVGETSIEGSTASNKIQFRTGSGDRMIINNTGVGIGNTDPLAIFDVTTSGNTAIPGLDAVPGASTSAIFRNSGNTVILATGVDNANTSWLQGRQTTGTGNAFNIALNPLGGDVGIGTATPSYALDIVHNADEQFRVGRSASKYVAIKDDNLIFHGMTSNGMRISTDDNADISINAGTGDILLQNTGTGNVGIGTASPVNNSGWAGLTLSGSTGGQIDFQDDGTTIGAIYNGTWGLAVSAYANKELRLAGGGSTALTLDDSQNATFEGDILGSATDFKIGANTSDGSDNAQVKIMSGGDATDTRGASIHLAGNEHGNAGLLQIRAGDGTTGGIRFYEGGSERMRITGGDVGIGSGSPTSYNSRGQDLVIKKTDSDVGISIVAEASGATEYSSSVLFADGTGGTAGYRGIIEYDHADDSMAFTTAAVEALSLNSDQSATFAGSVNIAATSGDSLLQFNITGDTYSMGIDNSDSDKFKLSYGVFENVDLLSFATNGDATFKGDTDIGGKIVITEQAAAEVRIKKTDAGTASLRFYNEGTSTGYIQLDASEDMTYYSIEGSDQVFYANADLALTLGDQGLATFAGNISVGDGKKLQFGAGNDLRIYHVADSNSYIEEHGAGALVFKSNDYYFQSTAAATVLQVTPSAGTITTGYSRNSGYVTVGTHTQATGYELTVVGDVRVSQTMDIYGAVYIDDTINITGNTTTGDIFLNGSNKAVYFNSAGSSSYIKESTNLLIGADANMVLQTYSGGWGDRLTITDSSTASTNKITSPATASGDGSTTLTTKGYVDALVSGATKFIGAWDANDGDGGNPDLTSGSLKVVGNYYIVSVDGDAEPNGAGTEPDTWHVGDWVIYSDLATDAWQKIDNTTVLSGTGTAGKISKWSNTETLTDSIIDESGDIINISAGTPQLKLTDTSSSATFKMVLNGVNTDITNSGTDGDVTFHTHNGEKFRMNENYSYFSNCDVGIGTTTPAESLQIVNADHYQLRLGTVATYYEFGRNYNTGALWIQGSQVGYNNIILAPTSGNVGIGIATPASKVHILGGSNNTVSQANAILNIEGAGGNGVVIGNMVASTYGSYLQAGYVDDFATAKYPLFLNPLGGRVAVGTASAVSELQVGSYTFTGGNGVYNNDRLGIMNNGSLTSIVNASTYNDADHPEYGLVFMQGPTTSSYNVWSISPDGPAKGDSLSFIYGAQATNIHGTIPKVVFDGSGYVGIGPDSKTWVPDQKLTLKDAGNLYMHIDRTSGAQVYLGATDAEGLLTTSNAYPLIIKTNNTQRVHISSAGEFIQGQNSTGETPGTGLLRLANTGVYGGAGAGPYGTYGGILFNATTNYTGSAKRYLITNAYLGNCLAFIRSADASTDPAVAGNSAAISSGSVSYYIASTGYNIFADRVGIGDTSPVLPLVVKGVGGSAATSGTTQNGIFRIHNSSNNNTLDIGQIAGSPYGTWLQATDKTDLSVEYPLILNPNGGNVGIGIAAPIRNLQVNDSAGGGTQIAITNTGSGEAALYIDASNGDLSGGDYMWLRQNNDLSGEIRVDSLGGAFHIKTGSGGDNVTTFLQNGNVGIGTASPDAIFHVAKSTSGGVGGQVVIDNYASSALGNTAEISFLCDVGASGAGTRNARILAVNENAGNGAANLQFHTWNGAASAQRMIINSAGEVGIGTPLAGETFPRELLDIRQSSGTDYPKILVKYDLNTGSTTAPTASLLLSPGMFSSDETAPRIIGYRTADFSSAGARSAGLKFGVAQNNAAKDAMWIAETQNVGIGTAIPYGKLHVVGTGTYNSVPSETIASDVIITSSEMTDTSYHSILQLVSVRQSLTTGSTAQGFLGFSTVDDSNGQGIRDAARIAIVNEGTATRNSSTALSFWTNPGGTSTTAPTEKMRIASDGSVRIGKTVNYAMSSPYLMIGNTANTNELVLSNQGTTQLAGFDGSVIISSGGSNNLLIASDNGYIAFNYGVSNGYTSYNEAMRIDNAGNVGIGTTGSAATLDVHESGITVTGNQAFVANFIGDGYGTGQVCVLDSATMAIDVGGEIQFGGKYTGNALTEWGSIGGYKENATNGQYGAYVAIKTRANGGSQTEKMRITSAGNVGINTTSPVNNMPGWAGITLSGTTGGQISFQDDGTSIAHIYNGTDYLSIEATSGRYVKFLTNSTERMRIDSTGRVAIGNTTSNSYTTGLTVQRYSGWDSSPNDAVIVAGPASTNGGIFLAQEYSSDVGNFLNVFSSSYNLGAANWGFGLRGSGSSAEGTTLGTFFSTTPNSFKRMVIQQNGSSIAIWSHDTAITSAIGTAVICTRTARFLPSGALAITGALSKGSGSFKIDHPLEAKKDTHDLVHSFVEGPQADLIYRGKVDLVGGAATINIDTAATMTEGTFVLLNTNVQCFTTNETDWDAVKGSVSGNVLTITCKNSSSTATISWMVIGERHDQHMIDTDWTDDKGKVIVEPEKEEEGEE